MKKILLALGLVVLALLGGPVLFFLFLKVPLVRNTAIPNFAILFVTVALAAYLSVKKRSPWYYVSLGLTLLIALGFLYMQFIYSALPAVVAVVFAGQEAPDFTLPDANGSEVSLSHFRGKSNVVLVFFRGVW